MKILIAIPALNEEKFLAEILAKISAYVLLDHILVVNDGSTDATGRIAKDMGTHVVEHSRNLGKGQAILSATRFASENQFDWILFMDADGQHAPESIPEFIAEISKDQSDVVLGNRQERQKRMPFARQLSNSITSILVSLSAGQRIYDSQCGYRAIRTRYLTNLKIVSHGFQVESEILIKTSKSGAKISHVPIQTIYGNENSSIHHVSDTLKFIVLIFKSFSW